MPQPFVSHAHEYLIYTRKSTDDADSQQNSLGYQVMKTVTYASAQPLPIAPVTVPPFCADGIIRESHTAFKTNEIQIRPDGSIALDIKRPKFKWLFQALMERQFRGVIALCVDRISRNPHDNLLIEELERRGVEVRFAQVKYDLSSAGKLHRAIDGTFAIYFSEVISEKVRGANEKLRAEGRCLYRPPLGYLNHERDENSRILPLRFDPERAPIVRRLFELCATGEWSLIQLARWSAQQGLLTKPRRPKRTPEEIVAGEENRKPRVGRPLNWGALAKILHNGFYIGKLRYQDGFIDGVHPPLITTALFQRVQQQLRGRTISVHYVDRPFFTYRGLLRCVCGRSYSPYKKKGHVYYRTPCRTGCANMVRNLSEAVITEAVAKILDRLVFTSAELAAIEAQAPLAVARLVGEEEKRRADLGRQQERLATDLQYLRHERLRLLRDGVYSAAEVRAEVFRLEGELAPLEAELAEKRPDRAAMLQTLVSFFELANLAKTAFRLALDTEKHELARLVFSELVLNHGNVAKTKAKDGFAAILERPKTHSGVANGN